MLEGVLTIDLAIKETLNALWRKIIKEEIMYTFKILLKVYYMQLYGNLDSIFI